MRDRRSDELEQEFEEALLEAAREVKECTPFGVRDLLRSVERVGAIEAVRELLSNREGWLGKLHVPATGEYFDAAARVGRPELTVERLVLAERWRGLFTADEQQEASRRLDGLRDVPVRRERPSHLPEWTELHTYRTNFQFRMFELDGDECDRPCQIQSVISAAISSSRFRMQLPERRIRQCGDATGAPTREWEQPGAATPSPNRDHHVFEAILPRHNP